MAQYDIDIRDYWRIIKKRKPIIIFSMITLLVFSFIFARWKKSRIVEYYSSSATIRIDKTRSSTDYIMAPYGLNTSDDIATEIKTITSFPVMAEVASLAGMLPDSLAQKNPAERNAIIQGDPYLLRVVNGIATMVQPERFEYTNIVYINTVDVDPVSARDLAQYVVDAYKSVRKASASQRIRNSIEFVENKIEEIESTIDSVQTVMDTYAVGQDSLLPYYSAADISRNMTATSRLIDNIDISIRSTKSIIDLLEKDGEIDDSVLGGAFADKEGSIFREKYRALMALYEQRDELRTYFTDEHPDIRGVTAKIESQKVVLANQLKSNLSALERQRDSYRIAFNNLKKRFDSVTKKNESLQRMSERRAILEEQYLEYVKRLQTLQIESSENVDEVTVIKPPVIEPNPVNVSTSVATISFIGLFLGTIIGMTAAFIFEALDTSIGTIEDVEAYLGVPVIGLIPQIGMDVIKSNLYTPEGEKKHDYDISDDHAMLVIHYAPKSALAESYRSMRTNIQFISYEQEAKVLLFTSTAAREGKTTSIVNLSLTMAQSGNHVLLVDGDLRRPSIDGLFGLERERGMSEILLGKRHWKECVKTVTDIITGDLGMTDIILEPGIDNLHIITCGAIPPNPSELLNSDSMDEFIRDVRDEYDIVLFDCSPTLPATDSAVLGRKIDGVVFVYAVGKVARGSLKRAKNQMDNVKASVIGVVLNGIRSDISVDFQDYKYKEYYYTYDEEEVAEKQTSVGKIKKVMNDFIHRFV